MINILILYESNLVFLLSTSPLPSCDPQMVWTGWKYAVWSKDEDIHCWNQEWVLKLSAISSHVEEDDGNLNVTPTATTFDLLTTDCLNHNLFAIRGNKTPLGL